MSDAWLTVIVLTGVALLIAAAVLLDWKNNQ